MTAQFIQASREQQTAIAKAAGEAQVQLELAVEMATRINGAKPSRELILGVAQLIATNYATSKQGKGSN